MNLETFINQDQEQILIKIMGPVNFPVIAYEFAANCNCSVVYLIVIPT
jgi:hypothetical protein